MRKRRVRRKYNYKRVLLLILTVCLLSAAAAWMIFGRTPAQKDEPGMLPSAATREIMIIGVDPREDDVGRSDTLMLVTLDEKKKRASILSIPRDTRVKFEGGTYDKINHAYAYGGQELSKKMVERLLGTKIENYVLVDITAFERMVDAVGGVDIDVEKRMFYEDPWDVGGGLIIDLQPGEQHLGGEAAMGYVRYRDDEGDIGRIKRQQKFVRAFIARATSPEVVQRLPSIVRELSSSFKTDIAINELISIVSSLPDIRANGIDSGMLPGRPGWWNGSSYWLPDIEASRKLLAEKMGTEFSGAVEVAAREAGRLYTEELPKELVNVDGTLVSESASTVMPKLRPEDISVNVLNTSGITGAAAEAADVLRARGLKISNVGNGDTSAREKTLLRVPKRAEKFFENLPFPCVIEESGENDRAVLEIGLDYGK